MTKISTFVWMQMTVVPTSMNFFRGDFLIWNLLAWTAPTVCQPPMFPVGRYSDCSCFLRWVPGVEMMLVGPSFEEGGLPILVEVGVEDPLACNHRHPSLVSRMGKRKDTKNMFACFKRYDGGSCHLLRSTFHQRWFQNSWHLLSVALQ